MQLNPLVQISDLETQQGIVAQACNPNWGWGRRNGSVELVSTTWQVRDQPGLQETLQKEGRLADWLLASEMNQEKQIYESGTCLILLIK